MEISVLLNSLFPEGHGVVQEGDFLSGTGTVAGNKIAVVGTANHAAIGVELALALAGEVLRTVREHPGRAILLLVDTQGQRLRHRDELLGINAYMAHLAKSIEVARRAGHRVLSLVYGLPDKSFFANEIIGKTGSGSGAVQRELARLQSSGLVTATWIGNQKHYQANKDSPIFYELWGIVQKTVGVAGPLYSALMTRLSKLSRCISEGARR